MANYLKNKYMLLFLLLMPFFVARAQQYNYFGYKYVVNTSLTAGSNYPPFPHGLFLAPSWKASGGIGKMFSEKFMLEINAGYFGNAYDISHEERSHFSGISVSTALKFFFHKRKGAVAPVGKYFALEISYNNLNLSYMPTYTKVNYSVTGSCLMMSFNFGKNIVVKDRILLGWGTRLTVIPPMMIDSDEPSMGIQTAQNLHTRTWLCNLFQGYFTVGFLF